jgi:hypothetical protein
MKGKTRQDTPLRYYSVMAVLVLLYGSEIWTVRSRDESRLQAENNASSESGQWISKTRSSKNEGIRKVLEME